MVGIKKFTLDVDNNAKPIEHFLKKSTANNSFPPLINTQFTNWLPNPLYKKINIHILKILAMIYV